jgi:O-antigen/teichoic acid export membrane protein
MATITDNAAHERVPANGRMRPWRQLAFVLGEAGLSLISGGVLFILISRISGPELLGTYALAFAWLMLFLGVSSFGIPEFLMREVGVYGRDASDHVAHAMLLGAGSGALAVGLMVTAARLMGYSPYVVRVITIASLALIPASLNLACRSVFLALREMHLTFLALLAEVTITMSASLYLLLSGHGAIALMVTLVVAKFTSASIAMGLLYGRVLPSKPSFNPRFLVQTARTVFTFGIGNMLFMLTMRINVIMVSLWVDIASVGHFAAATKLMELGMMIPNLFVQLLMTRIAHSFNAQGDRDPNRFSEWYKILFELVVPTCVGTWVFARLILETLFGASFGNSLWILRILLIYLLIESADSVMSVILKAAHRQREDVSRLAFNPLTNIVLNLLLLPILGAIGAAIGRAGGVAASAILRYVFMARVLTAVNWFRFVVKPAVISGGVAVLCYSLSDLERPGWLLVFYGVVTAGLLIVTTGLSPATIKDMMSFASSED